MRKHVSALLALALLTVLACAHAEDGLLFMLPKEGPLVSALPTDPAISLNQKVESYIITWEPLQDVHAYQMGILFDVKGEGDNVFGLLTEGYMGAGYITDGSGATHFMGNVIFDSILLDGNAASVELAEQINKLSDWPEQTASVLRCSLVVLIIPKSGVPLQQVIEIPLKR